MINRIFSSPKLNFAGLNTERLFNFGREQQFACFSKLEQRYLFKASASQANRTVEPCTYDDFGLVVGVELDVSWI